MNELLTMLDSKYKRLEYIQSTGTQWIDLGLTANQDTTIKCRVSNVNSRTQSFIGLVDTGNLIYGIGQQSENNYLFGQYHKNQASGGRILSNIAGNDGVIRNFELRKNEFYIDNALIGSITYFTFTTTNTIKLFTFNPSSSIASIKMYNAQVLDGNMNLLRNMIPVLRKSDNEIGMLDLVEGKFYPNVGTGKFTTNLDTMYALIQGTPTVQDGRVSGFSSSNYLKLQEPIKPTGAFEIKLKFKISDNSKTNGLFHSSKTLSTGSGRFGFALVTASGGKLNFFASSDDSSWFFDESSASGLIQNNIDYYVKFGWTGTVYYVDLSTDDKIYNRVITYNSNVAVTQLIEYSSIGIYRAIDNIYPITNSIDLNRSYIKIDDTKYKLQAVVGYSQPSGSSVTITNGIASGFSETNYLSLKNIVLSKPFEIKVKFNLSSLNIRQIIIGFEYAGIFRIAILTDNKIYFYIGTSEDNFDIGSIVGTTVFQTNKNYWVKLQFTGTQYIISSSEDNVNFTEEGIVTSPNLINSGNSFNCLLGNGNRNNTNNYFISGTIDLNNTYIKINNKLWFNGQPA